MKKILVLLLVASLVVGLFAACSKPSEEKSEKISTVSFFTFGKKFPDSEKVFEEMNKIFVEKAGVNVNWEILDIGAYNDKMNLIISSGEKADICFTSNWLNLFILNVNKGAYEPLDNYLYGEFSSFKSAIPPYLWDTAKVKDKIYAVPNEQVLYIENGVAVQSVFAKKYGLDVEKVKSYKDLETFLMAVKEGEPNVYPIQNFSTHNYEYTYEFIKPTNIAVKIDDTELTPVIYEETQAYKDYLKLKRDWFLKGLIRKDVTSVIDDSAEVMGQKYAAFPTTLKVGGEAEMASKYKADYSVLSFSTPLLMADAGSASMNAILKQSKNKEKSLKVLELMNTDKELYNLKAFGLNNEHYKTMEDGRIQKIEGKYDESSPWAYGNNFNALLTIAQNPNTWEVTKAKNEEAKRSNLRGFVFDTENVKNQISQVNAVRKEYEYFETGSVEIENIYGEYMAKLKVAGIENIRDEVAKQIKEWKK